MKKQRGLILGLGLAALLGLSPRGAQAGPLTITVSWGANTVNITAGSGFAQAGSTADNVTVNTQALNAFLMGNGSAYTFSNLGASSNNPGALNPVGANLGLTGEADLTQAGDTTISVSVSQTGFTAPTGSGSLNHSSSALYTFATPGDTTTTTGSYNATDTAPLTYTKSGSSNPQSFNGNAPLGGLSVPTTGYSLDNSVLITMSAAGIANGAKDGFTASVKLQATPVPEPAGIVMMVTGMPLPLVVMGLLRRRRAAA